MFRRFTAWFLVALLVVSLALPQATAANPKSEKDVRLAEKVKAGIVKLGVGQESRIKLKLKNKTKLAGYISEAGEDYFMVTTLDTSKPTAVAYTDVSQVQGNNLSTRTKIIITASIVAGVIIVLFIVKGALCDGC